MVTIFKYKILNLIVPLKVERKVSSGKVERWSGGKKIEVIFERWRVDGGWWRVNG